MALKVLILRNKLDAKLKALEALRAKDADFATREAELETAINEVTEETSEEDKSVLENEVETFEKEKEEHENSKSDLEKEIADLEKEIAGEEEKQRSSNPKSEKREDKKGEKTIMDTRKFFGMNTQERDAFFANDETKKFLANIRSLAAQRRDVTGADILIPTTILNILRENMINYSKLYRHVNVRFVNGKARQPVMGTVPEAVWTEMCATLNKLNFSFSSVEVDGYKVGGYVAVCNSLLEDTEANNISLATEIIEGMLQAIGLALDKAILYGTGTKMPLGIVTALASDVAGNITSIPAATGEEFFANLITKAGLAKSAYSRGTKFWAMNETTYTSIIANAITFNASGAIAAGVNETMPVINGDIEVLNFIPNNVIVGGYGDLYLLAERAEARVEQSEHVLFIEDNTVFKGVARYDGKPVKPEGFVAIGINGVTPTAEMTFAPDTANEEVEEEEA